MSCFLHAKGRFYPARRSHLLPCRASSIFHRRISTSSCTPTSFSPFLSSSSRLLSHPAPAGSSHEAPQEGRHVETADASTPHLHRSDHHHDRETRSSSFLFALSLGALGIGTLTAASFAASWGSGRGHGKKKSSTLSSSLFHRNGFSSTEGRRPRGLRSSSLGGGSPPASCAERLLETELGPGSSFEKGKLYEVTVHDGK